MKPPFTSGKQRSSDAAPRANIDGHHIVAAQYMYYRAVELWIEVYICLCE